MTDRLILVDGSALLYRAFFAIPPHLRTRSGMHTNAIYGFVTMFRKLVAKKPTHGVVVMDAKGPTHRDAMYEDYKAQRAEMPAELAVQLPHIDRAVTVHGYPLLRIPGVEADDVIGTLTKTARARGLEVIIISSDKDFAQLIGEGVRMLDTLKDVSFDRELVRKKWGVWPEQMIDLLALMGDASDNIPGVAGIGQKGAAQLLADFSSLDAALQEAARPEGEPAVPGRPVMTTRARKALLAGRDDALLSQRLATIDCQVPLPLGLDDLRLPEPDAAAKQAFFIEMEFFSLLDHATKQAAKSAQHQGEASTSAIRHCTTVADVQALLSSFTGMVALHPKLDGDVTLTATLSSIAVASRVDDKLISADVDVAALGALIPWLQDEKIAKVCHDAKLMTGALARMGITLRGVVIDTQIASFLIDPTKLIPHVLDEVVKEYLRRGVPSDKDIATATPEQARSWRCERAAAVLELAAVLPKHVEEAGQTAVMRDLELPLRDVLVDMERIGVAVDAAELTALGEQLRARLLEEEQAVYALAGRTFNIGSPKQLGEVLFDELKLPVIKRTKTGYSTDAEVLEKLEKKHPIARTILSYRKTDKLLNTTIDVLDVERQRHPDGRVRASFQQTAGATGRLITMEPDLQRTPVRSSEGAQIRRAFIATPGTTRVLIDADWSQIELRLLAHYADDPILIDAYRTESDIHRRTAAQLFGKAEAALSKDERNVGKTVNFATIYGQGASALAHQLGIERKEAQRYIDTYFATYAGVRAFAEVAVFLAEQKGYAETLLGRRRIIPELASKSPMDRAFGERVAVNTPIQGSAADICKLAMLQLHRWLRSEHPTAHLLLQIHDELVVEAEAEHAPTIAAQMKAIMEGVVSLRVPLVADVGIGRSWGDAK
jgi:DNA polymerase I